MKLLPFESYIIDRGIVCPACRNSHTRGMTAGVKTVFCTHSHPTGDPSVKVTTFSDPRQPHLHRSCVRCGFTWLEETAPQ